MSYGCHNRREYKAKLMVQDGWWIDGESRVPKIRQIPFTMTRECQYTHTDLGQADDRCIGCRHRMDLSKVAGHNPGNPAPQR